MKSPLEKYRLPVILKFGVYAGEVGIMSVLFYLLYARILSPDSQYLLSFSMLYGFLDMSLVVAYCLGVLVRPISFYYRSDRRGTILGNVTTTVVVQATTFLLFVMVVGEIRHLGGWRVVLLFALIHFCLVVWRYICREVIRMLRSVGRNSHLVVFVGANDTLNELYLEMKKPYYGYRIAGYFNDERAVDVLDGCEWLGSVADVENYLNDNPNIYQLYCSLPSLRASEIRLIIDACEHHCVHFYSVPQVRNYLKRRMRMELVGMVPVLGLREDPFLSMRNRYAKRAVDLVLSSILLIPFWLLVFPVVALCTKIFQPGPVFFRQKRNGRNGEVFEMIKFRSMKVNAVADSMQATKDDPRKTRFGNFLRKTSIDELPQLINVFWGDMSLVGPRPHMLSHTEEYSQLINKYMVRHFARPGMTGWAQVNGARGETHELWQMEDRVKKDIWYIENWSLNLDFKIMLLTIWKIFRGDEQAY